MLYSFIHAGNEDKSTVNLIPKFKDENKMDYEELDNFFKKVRRIQIRNIEVCLS